MAKGAKPFPMKSGSTKRVAPAKGGPKPEPSKGAGSKMKSNTRGKC